MNTTYTFDDDHDYEVWFDGQLFGFADGAGARTLYRNAVRPERYEFRLVGDDAPDADDVPEAEVVDEDPFHGWLRSEPVTGWVRNGGPKPDGDPRPTLDTHFEDGVDGTPLTRTPGRGRYADLIQDPPGVGPFAWFVSFAAFVVALALVAAIWGR